MLITFAISNFKSFKERVEFSMIAGSYKRLTEHVYTGSKPNLLRSSAIYGNNGAGKSNLLQAMDTLKSLILGEITIENENSIPYFRLDENSKNEPTEFEIEYFVNKNRYSYSISILKGKIIEEWLYKVLENNLTEVIFERFYRNGKTELRIGNLKKIPQKEQLRHEIYAEELNKRGNKPFFLDAKEKEIELVYEAYGWFEDTLQIVSGRYYYSPLIHSFANNKQFASFAKQILGALNLGIDGITVETIGIDDFFGSADDNLKEEIINKLDEGDFTGYNYEKNDTIYTIYKNEKKEIVVARLVTLHNGEKHDVKFEFKEESTGTQKIVEILPAIISSILDKKVYFYDEIESSVHPCIIKELLQIYLMAGSSVEGQLIYTTHECNLLDLNFLRQDEIWFAEKDLDGCSHVYSLSDFKPRFDKDIRKGFLEGQFTTIPFFSEPKNLNWYDFEKP